MLPRSLNDAPAWGGDTTFVTDIVVHIPMRLQLVCNHIANKVGNNEFSFFTKIAKREGNNIYLSDEFHIPDQIVSSVSIDYGKDPDAFVDTVIHRHPNGMNRFSGVDENYINANFKCSLLYTKSEGFVHGCYNLDMGNDVKLRLPIKPKLIDGLDIDVSMIQERSFGRTARPERNEMTYKLGEYATRSSSPYDVDGETDDEEDGETDDEEDIERDTFREKDMSDVILDDVESFKNADDNDQLLLAEITELKERIDLIEEDHDAAIKDLYSKCEDIEGKIDEQNSTLENALGEPLNA